MMAKNVQIVDSAKRNRDERTAQSKSNVDHCIYELSAPRDRGGGYACKMNIVVDVVVNRILKRQSRVDGRYCFE